MPTTTKLDTLNINVLTQAQYDGIGSKDPNQLYFVTDSEEFKKLAQLHSNENATGLTIGSSTDVIDGSLTVDYLLNCNRSIHFENGEQENERGIFFGNSGGTNPHKCELYGGNPASTTGIGCYDNKNTRSIWYYQDEANKFVIGDANNSMSTAITGKLTLEGHNSPVGSVVLTEAKTGISAAQGVVKNITSLSIPAGTWIVIGGFWTSSFPNTTTGGAVRVCLGDTNSQIDKNPAGNSSGYGTNSYKTYGSTLFVEGEVVTIKNGTSANTVYLNVQQSTSASVTFGGSIRAVRIA